MIVIIIIIIIIVIINIIIIFIINYKSKQKEEKMRMIFISIIDDNVTFTKVVVLVVSKKGVRKGINLSYKFINQKTNKKKSDVENHEFTNEIMISSSSKYLVLHRDGRKVICWIPGL